jgi:folate-binding Fe-S cluster repair protein YgfZ
VKIVVNQISQQKVKIIQQNSFNPKSEKLEILIIWHLKRVVPRPKVLLFMTKKRKPLSLKQADLWDMFKKASKNVCTSTVVVSPTTTQENTKEDPDDPELADERDIQMELPYFSIDNARIIYTKRSKFVKK